MCSENLSEKELSVNQSGEKSPRKTRADVGSPGKEALNKERPEEPPQQKKTSPVKRTPITTKELISYAWQISRGMAYLVEMKVCRGQFGTYCSTVIRFSELF